MQKGVINPPRKLMGSTSEVRVPVTTFEDDKMYDVKLKRSVEYPPNSMLFINPAQRITIKGSVASTFGDAIDVAYEVLT
jgi:hypothetical protein